MVFLVVNIMDGLLALVAGTYFFQVFQNLMNTHKNGMSWVIAIFLFILILIRVS